MTTTYDPRNPVYFDEADVRGELTRVFDLCQAAAGVSSSVRRSPRCSSMIERHDDRDAGRLTPADQDQVVDECFQCKRCSVNCPYTPELHEWNVDFPASDAARRRDAARERHQVGRDRATGS
jgi:glycerol-3-phosphate dehydrogenase subunit C